MSQQVERILKRGEVEHITGLSRSEIYRKIQSNTFPSPVRLGPQAVGWRLSAVQAWIAMLEPTRKDSAAA